MSNQAKPIASPEEVVGVGAPLAELEEGFTAPVVSVRARPIPRVSIQAICEGRDPGDLTTIEDATALAQIREALGEKVETS